MPESVSRPTKLPDKPKVSLVPVVIGAVTLAILLAAYFYLQHGGTATEGSAQASAEAKAYVKNLDLSDVQMQAAENFMQQRVVEIDGKITNNGPRPLDSIDVFCLFYNVNGRMIHRERVSVVRAKAQPLQPRETRVFRLPFDALPDGWNQAMPHLVIAQITFVH